MLIRQKIVLKMLSLAGGRLGKLDLVKLLFLLSKEGQAVKDSGTFYQFLPYRFGPFSFALYNELNGMDLSGAVALSSNEVILKKTPAKETASLEPDIANEAAAIWNRYGGMATGRLVAYVYDKYPWYALNSELENLGKHPQPKATAGIYMAGYEGMQIDGFLDLLLRGGVRMLIDVRGNPHSRKYGFHKTTMERLCRDVKLEYRHFPQLGVPSEWRTDLENEGDYRKLFDRYREEVLPEQTGAVDEVAGIMQKKPAALVCRELMPAQCHRTSLAEEVHKKTGLTVCDLRYA